MSWFLRGVQSAVFHYASCAPCTGYSDGRKRRKAARAAHKVKVKLQLEDPDAYHHPPPTGTNPFWDEEIQLGPGPPPRRARRTNTGSTRAITTAGTQSSVLSKGALSLDGEGRHGLRSSEDTVHDETWNHKRYQREDEDLWGIDEPPIPIHHLPSGSSSGGTGYNIRRPGTGRSESYCSVRAPPVNDLHPPVVSLPPTDPAESRWMLQPPPKASVMAGRERASNRSRSVSGASSRVELSLQRQLSTKVVKQRLDRGETPEMPSVSRNSSYSNLVSGQRHEMSRTPQARPPSASSSRRRRKREPTLSRSNTISTQLSVDASDSVVKSISAPTHTAAPDLKVPRARPSRPVLSTVVSSGSGADNLTPSTLPTSGSSSDENTFPGRPSEPNHHRDFTMETTTSSDSYPYLMKHRAPVSSSDVSSLHCLEELVSPRDLLKSRFVSAPLIEAKIRLPPEDTEEAQTLSQKQSWVGSGFAISRGWGAEQTKEPARVPFDSRGAQARDPRLRWSVDF